MALAENRKARFDYEILDDFEVGIELLGREVKSTREGKMNLTGAYAIIRGGEVYLVGADIPSYQPKNVLEGYDPQRTRRLLLHKKEIERLAQNVEEKGLTLVPLKVYDKGGKVKVLLGLSRRKKKQDKREKIKKEEVKREMKRILKRVRE
ncbi:MAG: SsrA-binding protein SmpB [Candidatus Pacebacteria bacterium]|nr:SsrA-binding protein SmpB [Candidatus Paceibacterota bacterium]